MAKTHITEIMDRLKSQNIEENFFLEIYFNNSKEKKSGIVDHEYQNAVITVDCPYGCVTISFDEEGQLKSIEIC